MTESSRAHLKRLLVAHYATLVRRLERIAGSKEEAVDAMHETWLRLEAMPEIGPVTNAPGYLRNMLNNVVVDLYRNERRHIHEEEIDELFEVQDELADPERIVAARRKIESLKVVLMGLTPRRRSILLAARVEGRMNQEIAETLGISLRLVEKELSIALKSCADQLLEMNQAYEGAGRGRRKF
jgi:RNA polymerase sigma factor (sigma-70 family)